MSFAVFVRVLVAAAFVHVLFALFPFLGTAFVGRRIGKSVGPEFIVGVGVIRFCTIVIFAVIIFVWFVINAYVIYNSFVVKLVIFGIVGFVVFIVIFVVIFVVIWVIFVTSFVNIAILFAKVYQRDGRRGDYSLWRFASCPNRRPSRFRAFKGVVVHGVVCAFVEWRCTV